MLISEFEHARIEKLLQKFCEKQESPAHIHGQLCGGFRVDMKKQTIELFENSPSFHAEEIIDQGHGP